MTGVLCCPQAGRLCSRCVYFVPPGVTRWNAARGFQMGLRTGALESRKAAFRLDSRSHAQPRPLAPGDTDQHCWALSGPHSPGGTGFWPEGGLGTGVPGGFGQTVPQPSGRRRFPSPQGGRPPRWATVRCPGRAPPGPRPQRVCAPQGRLGRSAWWRVGRDPPRGAAQPRGRTEQRTRAKPAGA